MAIIKEPTEQVVNAEDALFAKGYASFSQGHEFWIVVGRGAFAFRYGPFTGPEAGKILEWSVKERVAVTLVGQFGPAFDYELARDFGMRMVLPEDRRTPLGLLRKLWKMLGRKQ